MSNTKQQFKICTKCKKTLPISSFGIAKKYSDGLNIYCKDCIKLFTKQRKDKKAIYDKKYLKDHKKEKSLYLKNYYINNKINILNKSAIYRKNNKEKIQEKDHIYKETHKEELSIKGKIYYTNNKVEILKKQRIYSRKKETGWSNEAYEEALKVQNNKCALCGMNVKDAGTLCADHDHETGGIRSLLCDRCNRGLGYFKDNPEVLRKAAAMIEFYKQHITTDKYIPFRE